MAKTEEVLGQLLEVLNDPAAYAAKGAELTDAKNAAELALERLALGEETVAARTQAFNDRESARIELAKARAEAGQFMKDAQAEVAARHAALDREWDSLRQHKEMHERACQAAEDSVRQRHESLNHRERTAAEKEFAANARRTTAEAVQRESMERLAKLKAAVAEIN